MIEKSLGGRNCACSKHSIFDGVAVSCEIRVHSIIDLLHLLLQADNSMGRQLLADQELAIGRLNGFLISTLTFIMSNAAMQGTKMITAVLAFMLFGPQVTSSLPGSTKVYSHTHHLRFRRLENGTVSIWLLLLLPNHTMSLRLNFLSLCKAPSSPAGDIFFTQAPSSSPVQDGQFDGSISAEDAIPAVIIGVASSVILCALFLFVTDLRDRFRHERLLEEREQRRQQRRETGSSKKLERTVSSEIVSCSPSSMPGQLDQPHFVEKASESSVSTMTSFGCLRTAVSGDLSHSIQVTALTATHRVSHATDISSLVEASKGKRANPFYEGDEVASTNFKSLEGDCTASPISSVMEEIDCDDIEGGAYPKASLATRFDVSEISIGNKKTECASAIELPNGFSGTLFSSPSASQRSTEEMSMASSIDSVASSPDERSSKPEALESPSPHLGVSTDPPTSPNRLESPSLSGYATPQAPKSPNCSIKSMPDVSYGTPMQSPVATPLSSCSSVKLLGEECLLHSLQHSPDTISSNVDREQYRQWNDLAQLEQLYCANRDIPVQEYANSGHSHQVDATDDGSSHVQQEYIRHVYFVAVTNTSSPSLGIALEGAADEETFPMVKSVQDASPLLDRLFVGDQILAVNNVHVNGFCASKVTELCFQKGVEEDSEEDSHVANVVKFTVMSSHADGSESSSSSREADLSVASERSETESEV